MDIGDLIYVVFVIVAVIMSMLNKNKKKKTAPRPQPVEAPQPRQRAKTTADRKKEESVQDLIREILEGRQKASSPPPPPPAAPKPTYQPLRRESIEAGPTLEDSYAPLDSLANDYELQNDEDHSILHSLDHAKEAHARYGATHRPAVRGRAVFDPKHFNMRDAIIYSEIINRKY